MILGNIRAAYQLTEELLAMFPNHDRAKGNLVYYKSVLESENETEKKKGEDAEVSI